jgi:hypothetical protein
MAMLLMPIVIAVMVFASLLVGAFIGFIIGRAIPDHHLSSESRDVVKLGIGLVATIAALVLGLATVSAKSSFDAQDKAVKIAAADILLLDRVLAAYGPEVKETRALLRLGLARALGTIWPEDASDAQDLEVPDLEPGTEPPIDRMEAQLRMLTPGNDSQRWLQSRALQVLGDLQLTRWLAIAASGHSVPVVFLVIVVSWLTFIFGSFGLFAPPNITVAAVLVVCAAAASTSILLILEMDEPYGGLLKVSSAPLRYALAHIGQ